jgi:hypothetical protein
MPVGQPGCRQQGGNLARLAVGLFLVERVQDRPRLQQPAHDGAGGRAELAEIGLELDTPRALEDLGRLIERPVAVRDLPGRGGRHGRHDGQQQDWDGAHGSGSSARGPSPRDRR